MIIFRVFLKIETPRKTEINVSKEPSISLCRRFFRFPSHFCPHHRHHLPPPLHRSYGNGCISPRRLLCFARAGFPASAEPHRISSFRCLSSEEGSSRDVRCIEVRVHGGPQGEGEAEGDIPAQANLPGNAGAAGSF